MQVEPAKPQQKRLRNLPLSPDENPLIDPAAVPLRKKTVKSTLQGKTLVDVETGEVAGASYIHQVEEKDADEFVKVFAAGIAAAYDLTRTGQRVFQAILGEYEKAPMRAGYVDTVYLCWFDGGLCGHAIGMSESTYNRGLWELLDKHFIAPCRPNIFWVNPSLFFKGNRAIFVKEYRKKTKEKDKKVVAKTDQELLEDLGQTRLVE